MAPEGITFAPGENGQWLAIVVEHVTDEGANVPVTDPIKLGRIAQHLRIDYASSSCPPLAARLLVKRIAECVRC